MFLKIKSYLIAVALMAVYFPVISQNYTFSYDDAGNRTERNTIILTKSVDQYQQFSEDVNDDEPTVEGTIDDLSGEITLKFYPNPTKGVVNVSIKSESILDNVTYRLIDLSGKEILSGTDNSGNFIVDLNKQTSGIYNIWLMINGTEKSWKLIKE